METIEKVAAYITWQGKLLVFRHTDYPDAGIQVPAGTVEPGEEPGRAVFREAFEESGLSDLTLVCRLGEDLAELPREGELVRYHRTFYHLEANGELPEVWRHREEHPYDNSAPYYEFELYWSAISGDMPPLAGRQDRFIPELVQSLQWAGHIRRCFELARSAAARGNEPFGALLVRDGQVILSAENTVLRDPGQPGADPTRHAETNLIRLAAAVLSPETLRSCTLVTSTEPCMMCTGAVHWAGIPEVVFGVSAETLGRLAGDSFVLNSRFLLGEGRSRVRVIGPVLEEEGIRAYEGWW